MDKYPLAFCEECPVRGDNNGPIWTKGPAAASIVVVGEAPGYYEIQEREPFVGPAGKLLMDSLREVGFNPQQDLLFVNTVLCRPDNNANPPLDVVDACRENAIKIIKSHPRELVILCGNFPLYAAGLAPEPKGVTAKRGKILHSDVFDCDCMITVHPAFVLRNQPYLTDMMADFQRARSYISGDKHRPTLDVDPIVLTADNIEVQGPRILNAERVGWDTETDPNGKVFCIGFAISEEETFYLPIWINRKAQWNTGNVHLLRTFLDQFAEHKGTLSAHSASSDILWFQDTFGRPMTAGYRCTMITSHILDETRRLGLGYLLETTMGYQNYKHEIEAWFAAQGMARKVEIDDPEAEYDSDEESDLAELDDVLNRDYTTLPAEMVKTYVCRDALATYLLDGYFEPQMNDQLRDLRDNLDQPVDLCFGRATKRGVLVDRDTLKEISEHLQEVVPSLKEQLGEMVGTLPIRRKKKGEYYIKEETFNPASHDMVRHFLYQVRGYPVLDYTDKTKMPGTGAKTVLVPLHKSNPEDEVLELLLQFRTAHKNLTTYITGPKAGFHNVIGKDGRVHSRFLITSTVTARTCVHGSTLLETTKGAVRIDELVIDPDDPPLIETHTGLFRPIVKRIYKGKDEMVCVTMSDGQFIECTPAHRLRGLGNWIAVKDLKIGQRLVCGPYATSARQHDQTLLWHYGVEEVESIEPIGIHDVWDIEVEDDHSYVAHELVHHNSSRNPNLQNLPDPMPSVLTPDPGYVFCYGDLAQAELRCAQQLSGCQVMKEILDATDPHRAAAARAFNVPEEEVTKRQRSNAKAVVFGTIYGEDAEHLAQGLGLHKINWQLPFTKRLDTISEKLEELERDVFVDAADIELLRRFIGEARQGKVTPSELFDTFHVDRETQARVPEDTDERNRLIAAVLERVVGTIEASAIQATVLQPLTGLRQYIDEMHRCATEPPYKVEGYRGRTRRLWFESKYGSKGRAKRQAANAPIQSMAADLLKQAVLDVDTELVRRGWDTGRPDDMAWFVLQIHDSMTFQAKEECAEAVAKMMHEAMNFTVGETEFKADIEIKQRLAKKELHLLTLHKMLRD